MSLSKILVASALYAAAVSGADLPEPRIFAPGVISGPANDGSPTFSPDGNTLFFTRSSARWSMILESRRMAAANAGSAWSEPELASFSGIWPDASPAFSPDGSFLVFVSVRPLPSGAGLNANAGQKAARSVSHIWKVVRAGTGWSEPQELPVAVNFCDMIFRPSVASDGSVYFTAAGQGKNLRLFRSRLENGSYKPAEALSFSDGSVKDVDPEIAPDQSFVIFTSLGRTAGESSHEKLFISYLKGSAWGGVSPLRYAGDEANGSSDDNDARLGPDHRTVYFSSDRSPGVHFPRTKSQAIGDLERMNRWDNGNPNIWYFSLGTI